MNFYVIVRDRFNDSEYTFGESVDKKTGDFEKCQVCGSPVSMRKWLPPLKVKLSKPSYGDFVFGTFITCLVSEKFKQQYEISGLKGIKTFEAVEIIKVNGKKTTSMQPPQYYNVQFEKSKAKIDELKSKFVRDGEVECDACRIGGVVCSFDGIFLEEGTWEGQDIFFPTGLPGTILVSQRFYDFVRDNSFTNIDFVPAEQYKVTWA
ncbi:MAG: hypothetical protein VB130_05185 [Clostridium sp.]|nr:hypothetical protein [Clostridium sp.]